MCSIEKQRGQQANVENVSGLRGALSLIVASPVSGRDICVADNLKAPAARGRVVYVGKDGVKDPIPNATLELRQMKNSEWVAVAKTSSNEGGHFDFQAVTPGKYELFVGAPQMVNYGARLRVLRASGSKAGGKEIVVALEFLFNGCGHASVRKVNPK